MITKRQNEILKVIVEEYIRTAKPVSSNHICKKLKCSSATIRNEMVALEELHLLEKNHFASGRIPSEEGYKYYVDNLMKPKNMTGEDMLKLQTIFRNNTLDLNDTIKKSIEIISEITNYTAVVLGGASKENRLKKVEVVPLEDNKILSIVITDKGVVQHKTLYLPNTVPKEDVKKTGIVVMQYPEGVDFGEEKAYLIIGIAGVGDEHLEILGNIVASLEDEELLENLKKDADIDTIIKTFG